MIKNTLLDFELNSKEDIKKRDKQAGYLALFQKQHIGIFH